MLGKNEAPNCSNVRWEEALHYFLVFKGAEGRSERTIQDYESHIRRFFKRYPDSFQSGAPLRQAVLSYLSDSVKAATYNLRYTNLKVFFEWCSEEDYLLKEFNPFRGLKKKKAEPRIVRVPKEILTKLLNLPEKQFFTGVRDYAFLLLSIDTGIRPSEALALRVEDINLKAYEVYIRAETAKTRVSRTLPFCGATATALADLIRSRHPSWDSDTPLFCAASGNHFALRDWEERLTRYSEKIGLKIRPYDLRHTFALLYLKRGGDVFALQRSMGHSDLSMTRRYIALNENDLKEAHKKASPVDDLVKSKSYHRKLNR